MAEVDQFLRVRAAARKTLLEQSQAAEHYGQHVVEVVRDAAGQLSDRLDLLHLPDLRLGLLPQLGFGNELCVAVA